mmetsp:Transcript_35338/g.105551  ORF Transcript_35338/g.105551 Transcript_35338/m.105551 type:complete len:80 (+) Transcript_35338:774-1013(+)
MPLSTEPFSQPPQLYTDVESANGGESLKSKNEYRTRNHGLSVTRKDGKHPDEHAEIPSTSGEDDGKSRISSETYVHLRL